MQRCRYFSDTMEAIIAEAKSEGRHERGPINLQATAVHVAHRSAIHREAGTGEFPDTDSISHLKRPFLRGG